jgi:hypothetical protein
VVIQGAQVEVEELILDLILLQAQVVQAEVAQFLL